jgi:hypothetical protein
MLGLGLLRCDSAGGDTEEERLRRLALLALDGREPLGKGVCRSLRASRRRSSSLTAVLKLRRSSAIAFSASSSLGASSVNCPYFFSAMMLRRSSRTSAISSSHRSHVFSCAFSLCPSMRLSASLKVSRTVVSSAPRSSSRSWATARSTATQASNGRYRENAHNGALGNLLKLRHVHDRRL